MSVTTEAPAPRPATSRRAPSPLGAAARGTALAGLLALALLCPPVGAHAADYRLGPQDRVRIKLVEWRPGNGEAVEWESLSDEYTVGASGRLSMPMLGAFEAGGKTPGALSIEIAEQLQTRVGLPTRPEVSVEVLSYRPFYVLGSVDKPGEYAFRPDVTALQAVGIAGGVYRPADPGLLRLEKDRIGAMGLLEENRAALAKGLVREARLVAETKGQTEFKLPDELRDRTFETAAMTALAADETAIAKARATSYEATVKAAESLKVLLDNQIRTLTAKIASQDRQIEISRRELATYNTLTSQGLAVSSRQFALERALTDDEGKRLDYEMAQLNARQDRQKAEQTQSDATNERRSKILDELSEVRGDIAEARARVRTQEELVSEASVSAPRAYLDRERAVRDQRPIFVLTRRKPDGTSSAAFVEDTALLEPGDVLKVEVPGLFPQSAGADRAEAKVQ